MDTDSLYLYGQAHLPWMQGFVSVTAGCQFEHRNFQNGTEDFGTVITRSKMSTE